MLISPKQYAVKLHTSNTTWSKTLEIKLLSMIGVSIEYIQAIKIEYNKL